ncbi:MAG: InlB B-repeat-containing protein [Clostridia bacterium]|nr:InlB B-repeat-containing protein [Clostridia bacterium]
MKTSKKKFATAALSFVAGIACAAGFAFDGNETAVAVAADVTVPAYSVDVSIEELGGNNMIVSRELPSENATSVTFEMKINEIEQTGTRNPWMRASAINSTLATRDAEKNFYTETATGVGATIGNGLVDYGFYRWYFQRTWQVGWTHIFEFDFENNEYTVTILNAEGEEYSPEKQKDSLGADENGTAVKYPRTRERVYENPYEQHFGLSMWTESVSDSWTGNFSVKCYDSTGKDLQVTTSSEGNVLRVTDVAQAPEETSVLSHFEKTDSLLFDHAAYRASNSTSSNNLSSTFGGYASYINADSAEVAGKGAQNGVLKYQVRQNTASTNILVGSVQLGRTLTKEQIAAGGTLNLRMYYAGKTDASFALALIPLTSMANSPSVDYTAPLFLLSGSGLADAAREADGFINVEIPAEHLAKIVDNNGDLSGFTIYSNRSDTSAETVTIYLDKIFWAKEATVTFKDTSGADVKTETVKTGATLAELGITPPTVTVAEGQIQLGWTLTKDGEDYFGVNSVIDGDVTLYAKTGAAADNYAGVKGTYYNAETGKYFTLNEDKTVVSGFDGMRFESYLLSYEGDVIFDGNVFATFDNDTITLDNVAYKKAATTYKVTFKADGETVAEYNVPAGASAYKVSDPTKAYHTFVSWNVGESAYGFSATVNADLTLTASFSFNETKDYTKFITGYYNKETGVLYNLKADKKAVKVVGGEKTELTYQITSTKDLLIDGKVFVFGAQEFHAEGEKYVALKESYRVTLDYNGVKPNKVDFLVTAADDYLITNVEEVTREYYTFNGWKRANGETYDFNTPVSEVLYLTIDWKYNNVVTGTTDEGCGSVVGSAAVVVAVMAIMGGAALAIRKKED